MTNLYVCARWIHLCETNWYVWYDRLICVTWRILVCEMMKWYVWHDELVCVTWRLDKCVRWRIGMCDMRQIDVCDMAKFYVWLDELICVTWRIYMWRRDMCVRWQLDMCVRRRIDMCDMANSCVWHDELIGVTWRMGMCDMTTWYVCEMTTWYAWHVEFLCVRWQIDMCNMINFHDELVCMRFWFDMWWLRLVGSLKLKVSFAKESYKRDDILQKRPIILRILLIVATPFVCEKTLWYRVAKTHRIPYLYRSFSAKVTYI